MFGRKVIPKALVNALPVGGALHQGEVREPRPAGGREGDRSTRSGPRRSGPSALATHAVARTESLRPGPKPGRRRPSLAWLGVVPFFAYAAHVPDPAGRHRDGRRVPERPRRLHVPQRLVDRLDREHARRVLGEHQAQPRHRPPRRPARPPDRLRGDPQGDARLDPLGVRHVLGRGRELRRHPARVRVHRHASGRSGSSRSSSTTSSGSTSTSTALRSGRGTASSSSTSTSRSR